MHFFFLIWGGGEIKKTLYLTCKGEAYHRLFYPQCSLQSVRILPQITTFYLAWFHNIYANIYYYYQPYFKGTYCNNQLIYLNMTQQISNIKSAGNYRRFNSKERPLIVKLTWKHDL